MKDMIKIKHNVWAQLFIIYTRYLIGGAFVFASLIKIKGIRFTSESGATYPINTAWHFFETMHQSGLYWQFIGVSQLIAGLLLMTQRYAKLGALINLPIIVNIFIITISYSFKGTPIITGLMVLANLLLILWDWDSLKLLINHTPAIKTIKRLEDFKIWEIVGLLLFIFTTIYRGFVNSYQIFFWFGICFIIGFVGLLLGLKKRKIYKKQ